MRFLALKEGEIEIDGAGAKHMNQKRFWRDISYVPQAKQLVFGYPAVDMVVMGLSQNISIGRTPRREDYDRAYALLEKFGLGSIANQSCNTSVSYTHLNARSLLNILSAAIPNGADIELRCTGPDEKEDLEMMTEAMKHLE